MNNLSYFANFGLLQFCLEVGGAGGGGRRGRGAKRKSAPRAPRTLATPLLSDSARAAFGHLLLAPFFLARPRFGFRSVNCLDLTRSSFGLCLIAARALLGRHPCLARGHCGSLCIGHRWDNVWSPWGQYAHRVQLDHCSGGCRSVVAWASLSATVQALFRHRLITYLSRLEPFWVTALVVGPRSFLARSH